MVPGRVSLILPCRCLADIPDQLRGQQAAELLAGWTSLWHPSLVAAAATLPDWHAADEPPEPSELDRQLVVIPPASRSRLPRGWCDELRATVPRNPPSVDSVADRAQTLAALIAAAGVDGAQADPELVQDFLALGYAYLQVELAIGGMQRSTVLDREQFKRAVVAAARAAVTGDRPSANSGLACAMDMLADSCRHYYPVDYYLVDVTLLTRQTLGGALRAKLASGVPTSLLAPGELIERLAQEHPDTLRVLQKAMEAGTASVVGGLDHERLRCGLLSPENMLAELEAGRRTYQQILGGDVDVFAQFAVDLSPLWPQVLSGFGMHGALCATFDGGRCPLAEQVKTRWESASGAWIDALSAVPLDVAEPGTWLTLGRRIANSLARDHVATVLLAGWPGSAGPTYDDLRRIARYGPVLGKLVTLDEYFAVTRQPVDWSSFRPPAAAPRAVTAGDASLIASRVQAYRQHVVDVHRRLLAGLEGLLPPNVLVDETDDPADRVVVNPWSFDAACYDGFDPLEFAPPTDANTPACLVSVSGCGYRAVGEAAVAPQRPLADGHTLRNEWLEVAVSQKTGGIQSLRAHTDRSTRVSQRLVVHNGPVVERPGDFDPQPAARMIADRVAVTRSDHVVGEITSYGRMLDAAGQVHARFVQTVRLPRGLPAAIVQVEIDAPRALEGGVWTSYLASRLAWRDDDRALRHGITWIGHATRQQRFEAPDWVQIDNGRGPITLFPLGLPLHQRIGSRMLDTLLVVAGQRQGRFQMAIGLDCTYPLPMALNLLTAGAGSKLLRRPAASQGWLLHVGARNVVLTHLEPLADGRAGVRVRLLETEGRAGHATLTAFRPFRSARKTDFRGEPAGVVSVTDGRVRLDLQPHPWMQVEAEW